MKRFASSVLAVAALLCVASNVSAGFVITWRPVTLIDDAWLAADQLKDNVQVSHNGIMNLQAFAADAATALANADPSCQHYSFIQGTKNDIDDLMTDWTNANTKLGQAWYALNQLEDALWDIEGPLESKKATERQAMWAAAIAECVKRASEVAEIAAYAEQIWTSFNVNEIYPTLNTVQKLEHLENCGGGSSGGSGGSSSGGP
jgi:hypothetical protein